MDKMDIISHISCVSAGHQATYPHGLLGHINDVQLGCVGLRGCILQPVPRTQVVTTHAVHCLAERAGTTSIMKQADPEQGNTCRHALDTGKARQPDRCTMPDAHVYQHTQNASKKGCTDQLLQI